MIDCPCESGNSYNTCCQPFIEGKADPKYAEQLMRARYTAHTIANIAYIIDTHHPDTQSEIDASTTKKWAEESTWLGIKILNVNEGLSEDQSGEIEFIATYRDATSKRQTHHEISLFEKIDSKWFFKDASAPKITQFKRERPKIGRNDLCYCGSGKKFKKCCA